MADRRGRKGRSEDLLPDDRLAWARETWAERDEVSKLPSGAWMLREAAKVLELAEEAVNEVWSIVSFATIERLKLNNSNWGISPVPSNQGQWLYSSSFEEKTIAKARSELESTGQIDQLEKTVGADWWCNGIWCGNSAP